jgi:uncharacterized protein YodC (DUF2158 family)
MVMAEKFKVGDTVQLKSGGPKMTVTDTKRDPVNLIDEDSIECMWFAGAKREVGRFPPAALMPYVDEKK